MSLREVETHRLAAVLDVAPAELAFLKDCSPAALAGLRRQIAAAGSARHRRSFERLARASGLLPAPLAARVGRDVLGPELVAQLTPYMPVDRAVQVSRSMPVEFLADVAVHLLPDASADLLAALDAELRRAVTRALLARGEYAVMGSMVDYLPVDVIADLAQLIEAPEALLQVTAFVEDKSRLSGTVSVFSDARIEALLEAAAGSDGLPVLCELVAALPDAQRERLSPLLRAAPPALRAQWRAAWNAAGLAGAPLV